MRSAESMRSSVNEDHGPLQNYATDAHNSKILLTDTHNCVYNITTRPYSKRGDQHFCGVHEAKSVVKTGNLWSCDTVHKQNVEFKKRMCGVHE